MKQLGAITGMLILLTGSFSCKPGRAEEGEVATFVLSDTMLASIRIDTTVIKPVESELRLSGKVTPDEMDDMCIMANVIDSNFSRIKEGIAVKVTTTRYPGKVFNGQVDKVYETMQVRIRLDDEEEDRVLEPEMVVTVRLRYSVGGEMTAIPSSAVIFDKGKNFVMVFRDKYNIDTREVKAAKSLDDVTYISRGLQPGEKVISKNQLLIYDALND